eukprot:Phypoly_transcript_08465.p1 GENE.Phypoly_transcript_08465~~Phypoly_transcript_08465.p1  ORF type:complete len:208 (+),score=24.11 Phypoly_transcript_08465:706-1329(+)
MAILQSFILQSGPCDMRGISVILAEKDRLRREAEELRYKVAQLEAEKAQQAEVARQMALESQKSQVSAPAYNLPSPNTVYYIYSEHEPSLVLDVASDNNIAQSPLIVFPFHGGPNQQFMIQADGTIKAVHSGQVLELPAGASGKRVVQNHKSGSPHQRWVFNQDGTIGLVGSDLAFAIEAGLKTPRAKIIGWKRHGGSNQRWRLVKK